VGADLAQLRRTVEDLDPGRKGTLSSGRKLLGIIPLGNSMKKYFDGYVSAQGHIKAILDRLASGKDELLMDNAAIDVERQKLWEAMGNLEQMITIARLLDTKLEDAAADLDHTDPAKAKAIRESALFYTRQRAQDLLTQMAVTVQGYLALDLVKKNNVELVKGVDRASTTTVAALRTAVTVAQALTNQRLVLEQITALNTTTANIIDRPASSCASRPARSTRWPPPARSPRNTPARVPEHLRDDGHHRHLQDQGARFDEADGRNALGRSGKVARLHRADRGRQQGRRRTGRALAAEPGGLTRQCPSPPLPTAFSTPRAPR
jgi:hypothetical protein